MVRKLALAVAMVAIVAAPAFAAVQNVKVGGDLTTTSVIRSKVDLGTTYTNRSQNVFLSQVGLDVQADLTDNVSTTLRLLNERLWGAETAANTDVDLASAYVTMKEVFYAPLTVVLGRQPFQYGNQLIVGDLNAFNTTPTVGDLDSRVNADGVKAILNYDSLVIDLFAAKISEGANTGLGDRDDIDLYGINANYKFGDAMNSVLEGYVFANFDRSVITTVGDPDVTRADKVYVPGLRVSTNPIEGLNLQLEGAYQFGDLGQVGTAFNTPGKGELSAYALQGGVNYALPVMKDMKPVLSAQYTYLSGDENAAETRNKSWQPLYENQFGGRIFDTLFTMSNLQIAEVAFEVSPIQDLTAKLTGYGLYQAEKTSTALAATSGATGGVLTNDILKSDEKQLGYEVALDLAYAYTEDVKFGVSAGVFIPGEKFEDESQDDAKQLLSSVSVAF